MLLLSLEEKIKAVKQILKINFRRLKALVEEKREKWCLTTGLPKSRKMPMLLYRQEFLLIYPLTAALLTNTTKIAVANR